MLSNNKGMEIYNKVNRDLAKENLSRLINKPYRLFWTANL